MRPRVANVCHTLRVKRLHHLAVLSIACEFLSAFWLDHHFYGTSHLDAAFVQQHPTRSVAVHGRQDTTHQAADVLLILTVLDGDVRANLDDEQQKEVLQVNRVGGSRNLGCYAAAGAGSNSGARAVIKKNDSPARRS